MAMLTVRNLPGDVHRALRARAAGYQCGFRGHAASAGAWRAGLAERPVGGDALSFERLFGQVAVRDWCPPQWSAQRQAEQDTVRFVVAVQTSDFALRRGGGAVLCRTGSICPSSRSWPPYRRWLYRRHCRFPGVCGGLSGQCAVFGGGGGGHQPLGNLAPLPHPLTIHRSRSMFATGLTSQRGRCAHMATTRSKEPVQRGC